MPKGSEKTSSVIEEMKKALSGQREEVTSPKTQKTEVKEPASSLDQSTATPPAKSSEQKAAATAQEAVKEEPKTSPKKKETPKQKKKMGRPRLSEYEKRVRVSVSMDPEVYEWLRTRTRNGDMSRTVNDILLQYISSQGKKQH